MSIEDKDWFKKYFPKNAEDAHLVYHKLEKSGWIEKFRKGWSLPISGFLDKQSYYKWRSEFLIKATNNFLKGKKYKDVWQEMERKKVLWAKSKIHFSEIEKYGIKTQLLEPLFKFEYDINAIMTKLRIPQRYEAFVEHCLVLKEPPKWFPIDRDMPRPELSYDPNAGRKRLFIEVFADTKMKDFKNIFFKIQLEKLQKKLYDYGTIKQLGSRYLEIYSKIYDWHFKEGKSYKEIKETVKEKLGYSIKYAEDVGTHLKRFKKYIGIGTGKK